MSYVQTKDHTRLYYNEIGTGDPVILIHGWPLSSDMWEYQKLALVQGGHRVISYDRRGFGKSSQPAEGYNYDTFADDLNAVINHFNFSKVKLVGFSMGGGEIARYLSKYGAAKVSKSVLISSVVPYMLKTEDNKLGVPESAFNEMQQGLKEDRPHFLASFTKDFYGVGFIKHPVSDEILNWTSFLAFQASANASLECVSAFGKTDFREDMQAFTMPTMIIHGTSDRTVPIGPTGEASAKMIPGAIFKKYEGAPHGLFITNKNQLNEDLIGFLK